jgi:hypothetical protein
LEKKRQRFPKMDAIYLIGNSEESIEALLADWKDPKKKMYNKAHVFFLSRNLPTHFADIHDDDIERIKASPLSSHLKVLAELNLQFLALEEKVALRTDRPGLSLRFATQLSSPLWTRCPAGGGRAEQHCRQASVGLCDTQPSSNRSVRLGPYQSALPPKIPARK